ncbi:alpha/beta fold hydrolase [Robertkochia solimangrovi]|uniref:alpha/beta fold hydrolase n=1 Tax=Robertkochia solimangrovi TaxID=2213046 RepID=UPI00117EA5E1|nr:alpha/beta hydrolase [Robertkochia solimangrovi]TRZ43801.1 alpha/beta hydrolase [Robertkochia solimangrovi]
MKSHILRLILFLFTSMISAQQNQAKWLDLELSNYEYPYPVKYIKLNHQEQELNMAYMDIKPSNYNGKNVVLFHGKNFNGAYWKTTIETLTENGFRVIVPDQIGFGKSSKPLHYQYTFQQLAMNSKSILDSLKIETTAILGHSMGGMVATRFALMYPEITEKLILENPIGLEDWKLKVPYKPVEWWYQNELKKDYEAIRTYQLNSYYDGKWKPEYDEWVNLLAGWTLNSNYKTIAWNAALTYDMIFTQPVLYEFGELSMPTLLIIGTRDRTALGKPLVSEEIRKTMGLYQKLGKTTQKAIPNSKLVEIPDTGHLPHIERFQQFIEPLLEFLKD